MKEKLNQILARRRAIPDEIDALANGDDPKKAEKIKALEDEFKSLGESAKQIRDNMDRRAELESIPENERFRANFGVNESEERDIGKFSMLKFLSNVFNGRQLTGIEAEMAHEAAKEAQRAGAQIEGAGIPLMVLAAANRRIRNDMTATGQTSTAGDQGGTTIQTDLRGLVSPLYSKTVLAGLGATIWGGLLGNISIPTIGDTTEQTEKAENGDADEVTALTGSITLSPKRLPVILDISKQLEIQSSLDIEAWVINHLLKKAGIRIDRMAINGAGSSNQPTGILNTAGIGSVAGGTNGAAPNWANIIALETAVSATDADVGSLHYLTNPKVRGKLKTTEKFTGTNGMPIWGETDSLNGYHAGVTTVVPSNLTKGTANAICSAIIFGNFEDLIIGGWGGIDVQVVTDVASAKAGRKSIVATLFYDAVVQRAASFAAMKDALTT